MGVALVMQCVIAWLYCQNRVLASKAFISQYKAFVIAILALISVIKVLDFPTSYD